MGEVLSFFEVGGGVNTEANMIAIMACDEGLGLVTGVSNCNDSQGNEDICAMLFRACLLFIAAGHRLFVDLVGISRSGVAMDVQLSELPIL